MNKFGTMISIRLSKSDFALLKNRATELNTTMSAYVRDVLDDHIQSQKKIMLETKTTHACPPKGSGIMPCCGQTPWEIPRTDRITLYGPLVTCTGRDR